MKILAFLFALLLSASAYGQQNPEMGAVTTSAPTYTTGTTRPLSLTTGGALRVTGTITPSGTQDVNVTQILGAAPSLTNPFWVFPATGATFPVSGTVAATQSGTWTVQPGNTPNTTAWLVTTTPSAAAGAGVANVSSTAAESGRVLKSGAGNLYGLTLTITTASGYAMLFNATSVPGDGAVTPVYCFPVQSNGTNGGASWAWHTPLYFSTGVSVAFSTTGCFTKTASATGAFFGQVQ